MNTQCIVCNKPSDIEMYSKRHDLHYRYCPDCEICFMSPRKQMEQLSHRYMSQPDVVVEHYNRKHGYRARVAKRRLKKVLKYHSQAKSVLEVGCATGFFLNEARKKGLEPAGVELGTSLARYCNQALNIDVRNDVLKAGLFNQTFDIVAYWDAFEHVYSPLDELNLIKNLLNPSGLLAIGFPVIKVRNPEKQGNWKHFNPDHIALFSLYGIKKLLQDNGFEIVYPVTTWSSLTRYVDSLITVVARKRTT